jgi:hypothetical protein
MTISVDFEPGTGIITVVIAGDVDHAEIVRLFESLASDPRFPPTAPAIWDLTNARIDELDLASLKALGEQRRRFNEVRRASKTAVVVKRDMEKSLFTLFRDLAEIPRENFGVFLHRTAATAWIMADRDA